MKERFLALQFRHFAEELALQFPQPPLKHLPEIMRQGCIGDVGSKLVLSRGADNQYEGFEEMIATIL